MTLRSQLGRVRQNILAAAHRRQMPFGDRAPIVSFTFDDFPRSAAQTGASILERFGARGTYYVAPGLMNSTGELGDLCTEDDILSLVEKGHEIGSHTYGHISSRSVSTAVFEADVKKGIERVQNLTGCTVANFAYPFGDVTLRTKKAVGSLVSSARGISSGFNGPEVDLNLLRANRLYGDSAQLERVTALVKENVARRSWLIFYMHDVQPNPSQYGCTPDLLEFAASTAANSNCHLLTVAQAFSNPGSSAYEQ